MRLSSFSVENYRSITNARKIQIQDFTVLNGPNNEGKSNVLRALSVAMNELMRNSYYQKFRETGNPVTKHSIPRQSAYDWQTDFPILSRRTIQKKKIFGETKIDLEFSLNQTEIQEFKLLMNSNINGILPVAVTFAKDRRAEIKINKQGRGGISLNRNVDKIIRFIVDKINFQYISAVRTASQSSNIVEAIISEALTEIEQQQEYQAAIQAIKEIQRPVLEEFSKQSTETLRAFVPGVKSVKFSVSEERRYSALRQSIDIVVDDGVITSLAAKGDGVQSLVALGLRRHVLEEARGSKTYIFAIEEPEAHLHPHAIHELKSVLSDIAGTDQLLITTHSGLLLNREDISSNVLINKNKCSPARSILEIRKSLGIRSHDNLINAEVVLLVEGKSDEIVLKSLLSHRSPILKNALNEGRLILDTLSGSTSLSAKSSLYRNILCKVHCFLDNDQAGKSALSKAKSSGSIGDRDANLASISGRGETELEDLMQESICFPILSTEFGINCTRISARNRKKKWSARMEDVFSQAGKNFDETAKQKLKSLMAAAFAADPQLGLAPQAESVMDSLIESIGEKLISAS